MSLETTPTEEAFEILDAARGKHQGVAERKRLSIELATHILRKAAYSMTAQERADQERFAEVMNDASEKAFLMSLTDQAFRSKDNRRIADQVTHLLNQFGIPGHLSWWQRLPLYGFRLLSPSWAQYVVPVIIKLLHRRVDQFVLQGDSLLLGKRIKEYAERGVQIDLARLSEPILSEADADDRMKLYLQDIENPDVDYISVKTSSLCSRALSTDFEGTVEAAAVRLRTLLRASEELQKGCIILEMEDYNYLHPALTIFRKVLDEPEFHEYPAGIALQAYLPESISIQKELTEWAQLRVQSGGAPIHIRIVKGAYLALEQVEASHKGWPQAPYVSKLETDANFKRMVSY